MHSYHICVMDDFVTEDDLRLFYRNHLDHKWYDANHPMNTVEAYIERAGKSERDDDYYKRVMAAPRIALGQQSSTFAWIAYQDINDGVTVIDESLMIKWRDLYRRTPDDGMRYGNQRVELADLETFLHQHSGKRLFSFYD